MAENSAGPAKVLSVGEVARRSGVAVSTVHFYESKGLIKAWRSEGNQRRYPREVLRHIAVIRVAQRTGIPLETIRESLSRLPQGQTLNTAQWKALSAQWRDELDKRIQTLMRLRDDLGQCIGCGCLSMKDCPLRNPGDALGQLGSGPMILDPPSQVG